MANENAIKTIAKVMIAAAWADGSVSPEEINSLKDLLFQIPEMTASDWSELDMYIETPVGEAERIRLEEELLVQLTTPEDKALAIAALNEVVSADGRVSDSERAVLEEIKPMIESADVGILSPLSRLMRGSLNRRSQEAVNAPNREVYLEDFTHNKIFYLVSRRLELESEDISVSEPVLRKLSLAGGLMAHVAYVDQEVTEVEFDAMADILEAKWGASTVEAALVAEVAVSETSQGLDIYRLSREFFETTTAEQRVRFLDVLFAVADGDGRVSYEETEEIRLIAKMLKLTHRQFIDAKLKIPT
ncbi:MAG: TerB family tellurite resistance protein [Anaerolineales bacterium]